jgi:rubrerythrin
MKKTLLILFVSVFASIAFAQTGMMRQGWNENYCPACGKAWDGHYYEDLNIPNKLPTPKNEDWLNALEEILASEKQSRAQYGADEKKYGVLMPYAMIIPQEDNHINWISRLFSAYGLADKLKEIATPEIEETQSLEEAYELGMNLEADLIQKYEWLIENAQDDVSRNVLSTILLQTRFHYNMFSHARFMGGRIGY